MNLSAELMVWLVACVAGLWTAIDSLRMTMFMASAVEMKHESPDVIADAKHLRTDQLLLVLGWLLFGMVGGLALFIRPTADPPPITTIGQFVTWGLIGAVVIWAYKTVVDNFYTRDQFRQSEERHYLHPLDTIEDVEAPEP